MREAIDYTAGVQVGNARSKGRDGHDNFKNLAFTEVRLYFSATCWC